MKISEAITHLREGFHIPPEELASRAQLSIEDLALIEDHGAPLSFLALERIANAFNLTVLGLLMYTFGETNIQKALHEVEVLKAQERKAPGFLYDFLIDQE